MNCPNCQTENPGEARFCLRCGAPLARRCIHCQAELPGNSLFCINCGQPVRASTPADDARHIRLAAATPAQLVRKVRDAAYLAEERRAVTVLFAAVADAQNQARQVAPDSWTSIINGAFDRCHPAIYRYEGTIARLLGDALLAFFGAPVAHEDDAARAVRAALDMLDAARAYAREIREQYGLDFGLQIGLNTGPVIVGPVGNDLRYEYKPVGETLHVAARLQAAAEPMTALIAENTRRFVAPAFELESIEIHDGDNTLPAYWLRGSRAEPDPSRGLALVGLASPMVGREAELVELIQLGETVQAGLGRAALIVGEPGLGKTRLIAEWKAAVEARSQGMDGPALDWAEGRCLSYGQGLAYHLLTDLLRSLLGISESAKEPETRAALETLTRELFQREEALDTYSFLGHLLKLKLRAEAQERVQALDPQALQTQYLFAVRRLLQAMAARRPLVLILEDLHWADPSSTELLSRLLPVASASPILLCMVTRPERDAAGWRLASAAREIMGGSLTEITLNALSENDSRQLVANLLEIEALTDEMRGLVLKKAEGNPFFVEEVIRMLIDRGAIVRREEGWVAEAEIAKIEIPDNLEGLLMARIDRLPEDVKLTLRVAAVIGRQFPVKVLAHVLEKE